MMSFVNINICIFSRDSTIQSGCSKRNDIAICWMRTYCPEVMVYSTFHVRENICPTTKKKRLITFTEINIKVYPIMRYFNYTQYTGMFINCLHFFSIIYDNDITILFQYYNLLKCIDKYYIYVQNSSKN